MEIIRSRLLESDYFSREKYIHQMAKSRSKGDGCFDIQPCRAKRKLFEETQHEDNVERTGQTVSVNSKRFQIETAIGLDDRFTEIEVFNHPPHPYRTVTHSPRCVANASVDHTEDQKVGETESTGRVAAPSHTDSQRQSSPRSSQTHLQDYYKPKKRPRLSAEQHKTPVTSRQGKTERRAKTVDGM